MIELRDGELLLRPLAPGDGDAVRAACADPEILRFIPLIPSPYTEADWEAFVDAVERAWRLGSDRTFAIEEHAELLGVVTVRLEEGGTVGYWLKREARGRGVMTRAVRLVVDWARREHGIGRLVLTTHPDNVASQRVAEKAGFHRVGTIAHEPPFRGGRSESFLFELR